MTNQQKKSNIDGFLKISSACLKIKELGTVPPYQAAICSLISEELGFRSR